MFQITSPAFQHETEIPMQYTCDGANQTPPLEWHNAPTNTQSFVLIVDDPDAPAGTWDHWIIFNVPSHTRKLDENLQALPENSLAGNNSWNRSNYGGPCPPKGSHRYYFKLYALDTKLSLKEGASKTAIELAMQDHILAKATLMGTYERKR